MNSEQPAPNHLKRTSRRMFIKRSLAMATGVAITGLIYSGFEACWINVARVKVAVPRLPRAFHGTTVALLTDIHHGPYTGLGYLEKIVAMTNAIQPDIIALGGDYTHHGRKYIAPAMRTLAKLKARLGVFAIPGNHEYYDGIDDWRNVTDEVGLDNIENAGRWIEHNNSAIYFAGVDDYWRGKPDFKKAMQHLTGDHACLLLNHNPDLVEVIEDERIGLVMSGHTHGGQVVFPIIGAPVLPSHFGQKYLHGLVQGPKTQVYVSRGLGTITPPLRFCAPPELTVLELQSAV